ncbi:hypothetical protein JCM10212_000964 [Sporobolomyces blumeae]
MFDISNWLTTRIGRTAIRRWVLVVVVASVLLWLNHASSSAPSASQSDLDRIGKPVEDLPRVDRTALDKLRLLEIHFGPDDDNDDDGLDRDGDDGASGGYGTSSSRRKGSARLDRPPVVAEIPEPEKPNPTALPRPDRVSASILDREVCGATNGEPCRFLVPAWLGEQETKAQQHLYQLGLVALALNRTLVLPNVSKSRLGTCYRNPFSFYYSPSSLSDLGIRTISQEAFLDWTVRRDPPPSAQVVSMVNAKPGLYPSGAVEIDSAADAFTVPAKPARNLCLRSPRSKLDFAAFSPLAMYPPEGYHKSEAGRIGFGESVVNTLRSEEVGSRSSRASTSARRADPSPLPDVLAFNYELRFSIMSPASAVSLSPAPESTAEPLPFSHFPYSETWDRLAQEIARSLSPFISIHWRTETLTPSNLAPCAESLLDKVFRLRERYPDVRNVYLATDYPIEDLDPSLGSGEAAGGGGAHSGTFAKVVTSQHHAAMRKFLTGFEKRSRQAASGRSDRLRLTTFAKEQRRIGSIDVVVDDPLSLPVDLFDSLRNLTLSSSPLYASLVDSTTSTSPANLPWSLSLESLDSGLLGILDKLIVTRSELFLTGVPGIGSSTVGACAKLSSFTNQLVGAREDLRREQRGGGAGGEEEQDPNREVDGERRKGQLWNVVQHWSLTGEDVD